MAAIKPHLALEDETSELEERYWGCGSKGRGLGDAADNLCPTPAEVIDQSHAELLTVAYTRKIIAEQLVGRTITPIYRAKEVVLAIDEPITGPNWNPMPGGIRNTGMLSWTTKMGTPSFSLPAGASQMGGSCPGAAAGQSIVPDDDRRKAARVLLPVLKDVTQINMAKTTCEFCYAEGGQYGSASVQYHQMVRYAWARRAITEDLQGRKLKDGSGSKDSAFVQIMIDAINRIDFELGHEPEQWAGKRFFRLHDSGDFFSLSYLRAWKHVADHFHPSRHPVPIVFWAPTRIWATGEVIVRKVNEINGEGSSNLIIRPSAYHIDQHGPEHLGPGWAEPSVTYTHDGKVDAVGRTFDWDCKAYDTNNSPSCRGAVGPNAQGQPGKVGCRACWMRPDLRINYTLH
jgi:hypothetical protein